MECYWKYCKLGGIVDEERSYKKGNKKFFHKECLKEYEYFLQFRDLYHKYVNKDENWMIIQKSINNWLQKYSMEYMVFCLCKVIRNRIFLRNIFGFYYILTDNKWKNEYKKYLAGEYDKEKRYGKYVVLTESEHHKLRKELGDFKLKYYIDRLDRYVITSGNEYKSYYNAILMFKQKDDERKPVSSGLKIHDS